MVGIDWDMLILVEIKLYQKFCLFELGYENGECYMLDFEYLCVFILLVEVCGYGFGQEMLQIGKCNVDIECIELVGIYVVCLVFFDGYDSGLYFWDLFYNFGKYYDELWQDYLNQIEVQGLFCDIDIFFCFVGGSCG